VLSIVIPAYAEARFLAGTLRALHAFLGVRQRVQAPPVRCTSEGRGRVE
jgi:hypothetical protein